MTAPARIAKGLYWDEAWSLVSGCTHVSPGCDHCWSATETHMRANNPNEKVKARNEGLTEQGSFNGQVRLNYDFLDKPLRKRKPTVYAVWNDLFHEDVPDEFRDQAFAVILACHIWNNVPEHKFLILTKRAGSMAEYFSAGAEALLKRWAKAGDGWLICDDPDIYFSELIESAVCHDWDKAGTNSSGSPYKPWGYLHQLWPLPNVWLGVTAENQEQADKRIPILLQIPAAVRWVSVEPMLGPINLSHLDHAWQTNALTGKQSDMGRPYYDTGKLDWVACGGESGHGARPLHPDMAWGLMDQCVSVGIPFFFKQWGEWINDYPNHLESKCWKQTYQHGTTFYRVGKKNAGRLLDGRTWDDMPVVV